MSNPLDDVKEVSFLEVLRRLRHWEQNANPGQDRKIFNAYISELNEDGSGTITVELMSTQNDTDNERLFSALFPTTRLIEFENGNELLDILEDMDAIPKPEHPEL